MSPRPRLGPPADQLSWACVAAGAAGLVAALARFWGANPGYADRFLVLAAAGWAATKLSPVVAAIPVRPLPLLGLPLVLAGVAAFPVVAFLLIQIGPRPLLLWWLALALLTAAGGLLVARGGWRRARAWAFPLLFPLFALPIPARVQNPLQDVLQEATTTGAAAVLSALGAAVTRSEFVLTLPGGRLRVEEACSGVRSLTALTAIAAFVAFWKGFGPVRGVLLVLLAIPLVAAVNVVRVVLSGLIQETAGAEYIRGDWHEALGFAMVLVGLVLVLGAARVLATITGTGAGLSAPNPPAADSHPSRPPGVATGWVAAGLFAAGSAATAALVAAGWQAQDQYAAAAPLDDLSPTLGDWHGEPLPIPSVVEDELAPDRAVHRLYRNGPGQEVYVWVLYWGPGAAIRGYHHPDVCWGNRGFAPAARWTEPVRAGGGTVAVTGREFRQERDRQFVLYWTQEGRRAWTEEDERAAKNDLITTPWGGHQWIGGRLAGPADGRRLTVVVVAPSSEWTADRNRREAADLTARVAEDLYRVCPWATPRPE